MSKYLVFFLFYSIVYVSLLPKSCSAQNGDGIKVKKGTFLLLKEDCKGGEFDFCSDGYGQLFGSYSFTLKYDVHSLKNYNHGVFKFAPSKYYALCEQQGVEYKYYHLLDSMFEHTQKGKCYIVRSKNLKRKVNKYYRRNGIDNHFNGKLTYSAYEVDLTYFYGGKKEVEIPDIDPESISDDILKPITVDVFYILDINSIKPSCY